MAGALVVACALLLCLLSFLWITRPGPDSISAATAIFEVTSAPIEMTLSPTATLTSDPGALTPPPPDASGGEISRGAYVQVTGTGGTGLRLREQASLNSQILLLGSEAEVFRVEDGPQEADGYTWWYLVGPFDPTRRGWAVENYLAVVQTP